MSVNGEDASTEEPPCSIGPRVSRFRVICHTDDSLSVQVRLGNRDKYDIQDLSQLPTYMALFQSEFLHPWLHEGFYHDCDRIFKELQRAGITIEGQFNCVNRLLNIPNPDTTLTASNGFLYYNRENDVSTYGVVVSSVASDVQLPAIQVHIERRREDRHGRSTNRLTLRKETLYLVKGLTKSPARERSFHREIHTFRVPRAYVDQMLMCDMYNYPKVGHLTLTRETRRGREYIMQIQRSASTICKVCLAQSDVLYYQDCRDDDCSVSGVLNCHGPTSRLMSNDVLFSRFEKVRVRAVEIYPIVYVVTLKATMLMARLYGNSERDFVSEINRASRGDPIHFVQIANVSRKIRSYFSDQNTCYMSAPGPRGQLRQSKPLELDLNVQMIATELDGQYVDRVNLNNFSLEQTETGIYHMSPCNEPYTGPKELGLVKLGAKDDSNNT